MVSKLKAALDARTDPDFLIMARTDALTVNGIDDAIERANLYREAGADMIFVEAVETTAQMQRVLAEISAPQLANLIPGGRTPNLTAKELEQIGYSIVAYPTVNTYAIAKITTELFEEIYRTGACAGFMDRMMHFDEFNVLVGLPGIREAEKNYRQ
jgi:methylisocitrate lyase